jgi:Bacteriophage T4-like portal protein (Gp20)
MAKAIRALPVVRPAPKLTAIADNISMDGRRWATGSYSWYNQLIQTAYQRLQRYNDYDVMDEDGDVSRALDVIADEVSGTVDLGEDHQLTIDVLDAEMPGQILETLQMALRIWIESTGIQNKMFYVARNMIKFGDCFFIKAHPNAKWIHLAPRHVITAIVDERDGITPLGWNIKADGNPVVTRIAGENLVAAGGPGAKDQMLAQVPANQLVRFSMCDDMSSTAPYGESILRPALRTFKQKQLIEDAVIIYRVQRAPERRVFYIDVGTAPLPIRAQLMEQMKNEIKQKKVPRPNSNGTDPNASYDKVYDPLTTNEDYFFPVSQDARGSRVETLPGGSNTGEVADLDVWRRAMWRSLKVPYSYMEDGSDSNGGPINDGKVGVAYIQELNFNRMVQRHQTQLNTVFDREFKIYLKHNGIMIDSDRFKVRLPTPQNFAAYRQQEVDSGLLSNFSQVDGMPYVSKRWALERFLGLTKDEVIENERRMKEELGLDPDDPTIPGHMLYVEEYRLEIIEKMKGRIAPVPPELEDIEDMGGGEDEFGDEFGDDFGGGGGGDFGGGGGFSGPDFSGDDLGDADAGGEDLGEEPGDEGPDSGAEPDAGPDTPEPKQ